MSYGGTAQMVVPPRMSLGTTAIRTPVTLRTATCSACVRPVSPSLLRTRRDRAVPMTAGTASRRPMPGASSVRGPARMSRQAISGTTGRHRRRAGLVALRQVRGDARGTAAPPNALRQRSVGASSMMPTTKRGLSAGSIPAKVIQYSDRCTVGRRIDLLRRCRSCRRSGSPPAPRPARAAFWPFPFCTTARIMFRTVLAVSGLTTRTASARARRLRCRPDRSSP